MTGNTTLKATTIDGNFKIGNASDLANNAVSQQSVQFDLGTEGKGVFLGATNYGSNDLLTFGVTGSNNTVPDGGIKFLGCDGSHDDTFQDCAANVSVNWLAMEGTSVHIGDDTTTTNMKGNVKIGSQTLSAYIKQEARSWVHANCYIALGWRDSSNDDADNPKKIIKVRADANSFAYSGTGDSSSDNKTIEAGTPMKMGSFTFDGGVDGNDRIYIGFKCY